MIAFLNSGILILASAAIIPILIYLFIIKKPRKVVFSTLKYIKASQKRQKSKIKLKNLLLLIIRCFIILLAIMALARPAIRTPALNRLSRHSETAVAVILDTSYSMDYLVDTRTELEIGKEIISELSNILTDQDKIILFTNDTEWNRLYATPHYDRVPTRLLASIGITPQPLPMKDVIREATRKLQDSHIGNREILVITDFREQEYPEDNDIPVMLIPTSDIAERSNISVQNSRVEQDFVQRRLERQITFDVVNHSGRAQNDVICQLYVNGRTITEKVTDLQPHQRKSESFNFSIDEPGWYTGYASVRNERLPYDTRSYFAYYHPEDVKVAYISNDNNIPLPLLSILEIYAQHPDNIETITASTLTYEQLSPYQFIIVNTQMPLTSRLEFILGRLAEDQKGVLFLNKKEIEESWLSYYRNEYNLSLDKFKKDKPQRISYINQYHPIMDIFSEDEMTAKEISSYWESGYQGDGTVLFQAGKLPLAIESGRNVIWLFDVTDITNRLLIDPVFPVMAYRTFLYCSYSETPSYNVGSRVLLPEQKIELPDGESYHSTESRYTLSDKGIYKIPVSADDYKYLAANIDYTPSEYTRMPDIEKEHLITLDSNWQDSILRNRAGYEIWKHLFFTALLLLGIEMLLVKKEERGDG